MSVRNLPFRRGDTASQGVEIAGPAGLVSQLPSATGHPGQANAYRPDLAGATFDVIDNTTYPGRRIKLRVVQAGADITVARKCIVFDTTAGFFGVVTEDPAIPSSGTAGLVAKPIDPAYTAGSLIRKYDWFYVIEEGWAEVIVGTTTTAQGSVMCDDDGKIAPTTAGSAVVGVAEAAITADGTATAKIFVKGGLDKSDAATA